MSTPPTPIRVLLVEDSLVTRMGAVALLQAASNIEIVGEVAAGADALALYPLVSPDVVITDLRMPVMDGVQLIETLLARFAAAKVLVLTHYDGEEFIMRALRAGALGYVTKESERQVLLDAIASVAAGQRYLPAAVADVVSQHNAAPALSPRELQILQLLCQGQTNKEVASSLKLSEKTISMFVVRLYAKLKVHNRAEAVALAMQKGFWGSF